MTHLRHRIPAFSCSAAFALCELLSRPWAEIGICDDWSYIRSAQLLAVTGHIHYVGWASAIVGWQLYLGAALIKLFGFSFTAPRLGTLFIGFITAYLMQRTLLRFGITQANAVLGTLTFVLSPLFLPLSATMLTDVPGFFSILVCLYSCVRALHAPLDRDAVCWISLAVATNVLCGSSRQIAWLGVLVIVPSALWLLRDRRAVLLCGLAATALGYLCVLATLHWFNTQPYALPEPIEFAPFHLWAWKLVCFQYVRAVFEIGLLLLPLSIPFLAALRRLPRRKFAELALLALFLVAFVYFLGRKPALYTLLNPFIGDWMTPSLVFEGTLLTSPAPMFLTPAAIKVFSALTAIGIVSIAGTVLLLRPASIRPQAAVSLSWYRIAVLFLPITFVYFLLLSRHSLYWFFDRYLLAPMFFALVCILLYSEQHLKARWNAATCIAIGAVAAAGMTYTHNLFALDRARLALANEIFAAGIPPSHVDFGWEMNGWYELQVSPYINEPHIVRPPGAYRYIPIPTRTGCHESVLPEFGMFLHLAPRYGISFDPRLCDGLAPFAPVTYTSWPFFRRNTLYVVNYPPPWKPESEYALPSPPQAER